MSAILIIELAKRKNNRHISQNEFDQKMAKYIIKYIIFSHNLTLRIWEDRD